VKKKRELTPEQKQALVERLQKARQTKNPPQYKSIHPNVLAKPASDSLSFDNVKRYLKTQKELLAVKRHEAKKDVKGALAKVCSIEGYIRVLENYLRTGDYGGMFYGEYEEKPMSSVSIRLAYDQRTGLVKRNIGTYYPDMGMVYTKEMWLNDNT
jgi:hypothetical protein